MKWLDIKTYAIFVVCVRMNGWNPELVLSKFIRDISIGIINEFIEFEWIWMLESVCASPVELLMLSIWLAADTNRYIDEIIPIV